MDKTDLDRITAGGCQNPGCNCGKEGVLFFHAKCHPKGQVEISYRHGSGVVRVGCRTCGKLVASVAVKEAPRSAIANTQRRRIMAASVLSGATV